MTMQDILSPLRRASDEFSMIEPGDRVAVGLSGGKDSLVLLAALAAYRRFGIGFSLEAVTVDMGLGADYSPLAAYCCELDVPYEIVPTDIGAAVFGSERSTKTTNASKENPGACNSVDLDVKNNAVDKTGKTVGAESAGGKTKAESPCALCARMRRGALVGAAARRGCNKLALGHNADDLAETFFLSMIFEGRLSTFSPTIDYGNVTVVRPLVYCLAKNIQALARRLRLPVVKNPCPADGNTKRAYAASLLENIRHDVPFAKDRIISALTHPSRNNLWK